MPRIRKPIPGVDPKLLIKDAAKLLPDPTRRAVPARRLEPRRADLAHRLRHHRRRRRPRRRWRRFPISTTGAQALAVQSQHARRRPIPTARSRGRSRSTPTIPRRRRPRSTRTTTSSMSAAWSTTRSPGRSTSSTRCRRRPRSPATSASRAGARSANGRACRCREFLKRVGADTRAKYVWFRCAEGYSTSIDMATALHPQTQMTLQVRRRDPAAQVRLPDEGAASRPSSASRIRST